MSDQNVDNYYNKIVFINPSASVGSFKNFVHLINARNMEHIQHEVFTGADCH